MFKMRTLTIKTFDSVANLRDYFNFMGGLYSNRDLERIDLSSQTTIIAKFRVRVSIVRLFMFIGGPYNINGRKTFHLEPSGHPF